MNSKLAILRALLEDASKGLKKVDFKKMFGSEALFADNKVFALIWKKGRIGLKLTDPKEFEKLKSMMGSSPWKIGNKVMADWVLIPESFHTAVDSLRSWLEKAHINALESQEKVKKAVREKVQKTTQIVASTLKKKPAPIKKAKTPASKARKVKTATVKKPVKSVAKPKKK